jgi:O-antigen/teichoic acid export membrane protein
MAGYAHRYPGLASLVFAILGVLGVSLATPGLDLLAPLIGDVVVLVLALYLYLRLKGRPSSRAPRDIRRR